MACLLLKMACLCLRPVPSRFYVRSGAAALPLVLPPGLWTGVTRAAVIGRLLPSLDASSSANVDLLAKMKAGPVLRVGAVNAAAKESWDVSRLKKYSMAAPLPLDLSQHQGVGMTVDSDGSGGTLVVRFSSGTNGRDYAVPLTWTGKRYVEVPTGEQGWSVRNWGPAKVRAPDVLLK